MRFSFHADNSCGGRCYDIAIARIRFLVVVLLTLAAALSGIAQSVAADRPNVVLIMTDNHGAWTLGCYGNTEIRTPHIDTLAREGTLFTHAFASNPVCSPTRATYLTGLMPSQHGVHCFLVGGRLQIGPDARCTLDRFTSLPEILADAGYSCGLVGKWHLGDNLHPQEGLTDYWITMPHGATSTFYDAQIIENGKLRTESEYLTDFWTKHAVRFIEREAGKEKPFFLFLSYNGPYSLGRLLLREGRNRHAAHYRDKELSSFPRAPIHPWQYNNRDYQGNPVSMRRVATEVSGVDDGVGDVMAALQRTGVDENTLVVFVADQGWSGGHGGYFGMGDHTRPVTAHDQMMRVPTIWRWPGKIAEGRRTDHTVANYDFLATMLGQLGMSKRVPTLPHSPGKDYSDALAPGATSETIGADDRPVFYEFESLRCIRTRRWKYVHRHPNGPHELYDLQKDPEESENLVSDRRMDSARRALKKELDTFFRTYSAPQYDLWRGGGSQTRLFVGIDEAAAQQAPVAPPEPPADFRLPDIRVPEGFTVELAAAPPLVTHPTLACLDDRGRLFVCNNAGVNMAAKDLEAELPNAIHMLEDQDGDGRFDKSTVFADKMTFPMGGTWHDGALYVASPPFIWRLEDVDGDGKADKRDIVVRRFGYTGNAASIHGCFFGPDGRLYWCDGYHGHEIGEGDSASKREGSYLFSCWPDGTDVRIHCGGGMDNPVEVDFTEAGDVIGTVNILYTRPRVDCQVHWQYGGAYPHRERVLDELQVTGAFLEPMHQFGHVAVSGTMRYRSGALDRGWTNNFFTTFFNSGKVVRLELQPEGSTYRATQREFLSSQNPDFHPTDVLEDADGSLLVVDTGGWFYRGCPTSQMAKPEVLGAVYRVRRKGMTTQPDPWGARIDWASVPNNRLTRLFNDTRHPVRERAVREAVTRGASIAPALESAVSRGDIRVRQGAVWALTRLARAGLPSSNLARAALRTALADRDAGIRQAACHAIAQNPDSNALSALHLLLEDKSAAVRRVAAMAIGRIGDVRSAELLLKAYRTAVDRDEEHQLTYALLEIGAVESMRTAMAGDEASRRLALVVLDQIDRSSISPAILASLLDGANAETRTEALRVFARHLAKADSENRRELVRSASDVVRSWLQDTSRLRSRRAAAESLIATCAGDSALAESLAAFLGDAGTSDRGKRMVLDALAKGRALDLQPSLAKVLQQGLQDASETDALRWIAAAAAFKSDALRAELEEIAGSNSLSPLTRVAAIRAASGGSGRLNEETFSTLQSMLRQSPTLSAQAAQVLAASTLTEQQLIQIAATFEDLGPLALRDLIRPFQRNNKLSVAQAFLEGIERARALSSLPDTELSDVVKRFPAELRPKANAILENLEAAHQARVQRIDALIDGLASGDAARGKQLFADERKAKCAACHRVGNSGAMIGPDLTTIGANRSERDLLESLVFPSASIVRQYEPFSVITTSGRVFSGLIVSETAEQIRLQQQVGEPVVIARNEIDEIVASTVSLMPQGLDESLTAREIADLVAYLRSLKRTPEGAE